MKLFWVFIIAFIFSLILMYSYGGNLYAIGIQAEAQPSASEYNIKVTADDWLGMILMAGLLALLIALGYKFLIARMKEENKRNIKKKR